MFVIHGESRRARRAVASVLVAGMALAGCGGDGSSVEATADPGAYAEVLCKQVQRIFKAADADVDPLQGNKSMKKRIDISSELFTGLRRAVANAHDKLEEVGAPTVEGGVEYQTRLLDALDDSAEKLRDANQKLTDAVPADTTKGDLEAIFDPVFEAFIDLVAVESVTRSESHSATITDVEDGQVQVDESEPEVTSEVTPAGPIFDMPTAMIPSVESTKACKNLG